MITKSEIAEALRHRRKRSSQPAGRHDPTATMATMATMELCLAARSRTRGGCALERNLSQACHLSAISGCFRSRSSRCLVLRRSVCSIMDQDDVTRDMVGDVRLADQRTQERFERWREILGDDLRSHCKLRSDRSTN
jgi:hypothetical protein